MSASQDTDSFTGTREVAPQHAFDVVLTPERTLASEDIAKVLENLDSQGFHLQMPPAEEEYIEHLPDELLRRNDPV